MAVELKPMTPADFEAYLDVITPEYAAEKVRAGNWKEEESTDLARKEIMSLFPDGLDTPDQYVFCIQDGDEEVGYLWIAERTQGLKKVVWIFDIVIHKEHRRKGYATQTFEALEKYMKANLSTNRIELHVFGHNHGAQALYQKLGFEITNIVMAKNID